MSSEKRASSGWNRIRKRFGTRKGGLEYRRWGGGRPDGSNCKRPTGRPGGSKCRPAAKPGANSWGRPGRRRSGNIWGRPGKTWTTQWKS